MPSANNRRNRRMRKLEAQKNDKKVVHNSQNDIPLAVVAVNHSINPKKRLDSDYYCSFCNGRKCHGMWIIGSCGCNYRHCLDSDMNECPCPMCPSKTTQESFSRNVAGGMVEVGELVSLTCEDLANKASNLMTAWSVDKKFQQNDRRFDNRLQPMNQRERDAVIRNVKIAKAVVGAAAGVTGCLANVVGAGCWMLGSLLSPTIKGVSKQVLSEWNVDEEKAERMVDGAMEIAKAAVITTGSVVRGVQNGSAILASGAASGLARMYENTHGFQPRELESDVGEIAKNVIHTAWNVKVLKTDSKLTKLSKIHPAPGSKSKVCIYLD